MPREFTGFQDFENRLLKVTHTFHVIDDATFKEIRSKHYSNADNNGVARFYAPMRADVLARV